MVETDKRSPEPAAPAAGPERADLAVAVAGHGDGATLATVVRTLEQGLDSAFPGLPAVLLHADSTNGSAAALRAALSDPSRLVTLQFPAEAGRPAPAGTPSRAAALRLFFAEARRLGAKGLAVVDPDQTSITPAAIGRLLTPVLEGQTDFVAPHYARPRMAGAITSGIAYPFTRALYGRRLRFPTGGDFACAPPFMEYCLARPTWGGEGSRIATDLWLIHRAISGGFRLGEACLGPRVASTDTEADLSAMLARVLGTLFSEAEQNQALWQKVRGSEAVPLFGVPEQLEAEPGAVDVKQAVDAFRLGQEHLRAVWQVVLPPTTTLDLRKLARQPDAEFRMPDTLWARIVYDFTLAYHTRLMSREHLLAAFTPLYLGWLASFVGEMQRAGAAPTEPRIEELCLRFEAEKPYLISRWRWPDRFAP